MSVTDAANLILAVISVILGFLSLLFDKIFPHKKKRLRLSRIPDVNKTVYPMILSRYCPTNTFDI